MKGGARIGAGRKSLAEEQKTAEQCRKAIIKQYGTIEDGIIKLLTSNEPMLQKWVFEHALGKPIEQVSVDGELSHELTFKVVRANTNGS